MSTTKASPVAGFTLIEVMVALCLSLLIAACTASLWVSLQAGQVRAADRISARLQGRVAMVRLELDVRQASLAGCGSGLSAAVLRADARELVLLSGSMDEPPRLVEWELAGGNLMRRHGPWAGAIPEPSENGAYTSSKTMLEGVGPESGFSYVTYEETARTVPADGLAAISAVEFSGETAAPRVSLFARARVGR